MEDLNLELASKGPARLHGGAVVSGVVASGNCEVLIEGGAPGSACYVIVHTPVRGFNAIWQAVLSDFAARYEAGGLRIEINDVGATPAVVGLRLDQAMEAWAEGGDV